ncbi:PA0069 family radical SAM protein [Marinoscillum furvescens]|uniref:DNA repair photolyase n=1 Tax=Marinoscillum furvescens DSM 4134 TaxID=1122208 RepID=A0A3D9KZM9_MARFU|nr:PA0069 family radical SAM protein [Marinoscillum furvescens]RED93881.1 DNA repair photolyase [Marinoscillum furvescens DSM 4134]
MIKGKGAQYNPSNPFSQQAIGQYHDEGIDEYTHEERPALELFYETPKNVISTNNSPDLKLPYSVNPYQGCEHGCVYCYARNSHTYWGFSAGLDFESKLIIKKNVASQLASQIQNPRWKVQPIMLSGNTDCYQPIEKKLGLTRQVLEVMLKYRCPVSIISKNALVTRDLDILKELATLDLVHVYFSITTLEEDLRSQLEPRTATAKKKLKAMELLASNRVPVGVMNAPIIPGLNHHEIPEVIRQAANSGALNAGYTVVRLNGQIAQIFENWLEKTYPDRLHKVMNQVSELHGGKVNDTKWGRRITGSGQTAAMIKQLFDVAKSKYLKGKKMPPLSVAHFRKGGNYSLF